MMRPLCWRCVEETASRPSRAAYWAVWATGEAALLCGKHKEMCLLGGGFSQPIPKGFEAGHPDGTQFDRAELEHKRHTALVALRDPTPVYELHRALRETLP